MGAGVGRARKRPARREREGVRIYAGVAAPEGDVGGGRWAEREAAREAGRREGESGSSSARLLASRRVEACENQCLSIALMCWSLLRAHRASAL